MNDNIQINHPSFGKLQISRVTGTANSLVGSPIAHRHFIALRISESTLYRGLNYDRFHEGKQLIEVLLSPNQFAEAITSLNTEGVPCTLQYLGGQRIERPPQVNERDRIRKEFKADMRELSDGFTEGVKDIGELLEQKRGKSLTKDDRKKIMETLNSIQNKLASTVPFVHTMFDEAMDKTVTHAKSELESYVASLRRVVGNEMLLESPELMKLGVDESPAEPEHPHTYLDPVDIYGGPQ